MAYALLKAMGFNGDIGTITVDLSTKSATATDGHTVAGNAVKDNTVEIDSTRYPFCVTGDPKSPDSTSSAMEFIPFYQDLNRLTLIVKNAPANQMNITWGDTTKTFSKDQLAKGINLAAEFPNNPFAQPFASVMKAVAEQQKFETAFIKSFVYNVPGYQNILGDDQVSTFDKLIEAGLTKDKTLFTTASDAVKPVHHSLKIDPA